MAAIALPQEQSVRMLHEEFPDCTEFTCSICGTDLITTPHIHTIQEMTK